VWLVLSRALAAKVAPRDELHDDGVGGFGGNRVVDPNDAGMGKARCGLRLTAEAAEHVWVGGEMSVEHLDRNTPAEIVIDTFPDLGHAASA